MGCDQRKSLLVLGTLKLILIDLLGLALYIARLVTVRLLDLPLYPKIYLLVAAAFMLINTLYSIILLCGSYKRHRTLLRVFFWSSIICFIISVLNTGNAIYGYYVMITRFHENWIILLSDFIFYLSIIYFGFFNLVLQLGIMILVRLEINKLGSTITSDGIELRAD